MELISNSPSNCSLLKLLETPKHLNSMLSKLWHILQSEASPLTPGIGQPLQALRSLDCQRTLFTKSIGKLCHCRIRLNSPSPIYKLHSSLKIQLINIIAFSSKPHHKFSKWPQRLYSSMEECHPLLKCRQSEA